MNSKLYIGERRYLERHMPTSAGTLPSGPVEVLGFRSVSRSPVILTLVRREKNGKVYPVQEFKLLRHSYRMSERETA